jgi:hypothetical protein
MTFTRSSWLLPWTLLGLLTACGSDGPACPEVARRTVELALNDGLVMSSGAVLPEANPGKIDLVCWASAGDADLMSGVMEGTVDRAPLHWFLTGGSQGQTFASLDDVPYVWPTSAEKNAFVNGPRAGFGFTLENAVSGGRARAWVKSVQQTASAVTGLTLEYEWLPGCLAE